MTALTLEAEARGYAIAGRYASGDTARSVAWTGFTVDVAAAFSQRKCFRSRRPD